MAWIVFAVIAAAGAFIGLGFHKRGGWFFCKRQWLAVLAVLLMIPSMFVMIPTGHTGIVTTFGAVEDYTFEAGMHFKSPIQEVVVMDNRTQKQTIKMDCFSSDIQEVAVIYSINYQIEKKNAQTIYKTIGTSYYETVMSPRIEEAVKSVIAKYTAENLIASRDALSTQITQKLESELSEYNIIVVNTAIEDLDFSDVFTTAVEAKQVAEQEKLKAAIEQEKLTIEANAKAEREKIAANAAAEVTKIEADVAQYAGEKEAEKNRKIAETITPDLIKYFYVQQWNGELPKITGIDSLLPIIDFESIASD